MQNSKSPKFYKHRVLVCGEITSIPKLSRIWTYDLTPYNDALLEIMAQGKLRNPKELELFRLKGKHITTNFFPLRWHTNKKLCADIYG